MPSRDIHDKSEEQHEAFGEKRISVKVAFFVIVFILLALGITAAWVFSLFF